VPVTAKLSRKLYDTLGEDVATELVDWFNAVDATYRADLRELNELNFARFDAKLEQRLAALDAKWGGRWTELDAKLEQRLAELDTKWGGRWTELDAKLEQRLAALDAKWSGRWTELDAKLEQRLAEFDAKWSGRWTELDGKWAGRWTELDAKLERRLAEFGAALRVEMAHGLSQLKSDLLRWMFGFWASTALALAALALRR
jgi:hypothetical protein